MNSRIKRKLRVLAEKTTGTTLTEKGLAKLESLDEKSKG